MNTRLRHALLAPGLVAALVGSLTVTSPVATAHPQKPPVAIYRITGEFGDTGLWSSAHTGLDFAVDEGTPIHAVTSGVVTEATYDGSYGNKTVITLEDGTEIWYCHQAALGVEVGQEVVAGEVIGAVGMTGNTTGPHLHLEVRPGGGDPADPAAMLRANGVEL
jgi:murein DD-endopeptidase MepM/ murein hydrolase activator NlpD